MNIETRNRFFIAISGEPGEQGQALDVLSKGNKNQRKLAEIGAVIRDVLSGKKEPKALEQALDGFRTLPMSSFWSGMLEKTGHVLINKGEPLKGGKRTEILAYGLSMFTLALSVGIPLSDHTLDVVKKLGGEADLKSMASEILKRNALFRPDKATLRAARADMVEQPRRKRPAKSR